MKDQNMQEEQINIRDYLQILLRRKYLILLVLALSIPFIILHALSQKQLPQYRAVSKLMIEKAASPALITSEGFRYDPGFLDTQTQIIKSSRVAEKVVRTLNLVETYDRYFQEIEFKPSLWQKVLSEVKELPGKAIELIAPDPDSHDQKSVGEYYLTEEQKKEARVKSLAAMISAGITVQPMVDMGSIVEVAFVSSSPVFAEKIVNNVASAYRGILVEMRMESSREAIDWMKNQAEAQRAHLEASENILQEYKRKHNLYTVGDQEGLIPGRITRLSQRLTEAQAEVIELESQYRELSRISSQQALNLPVVADNPIIRDLRLKILNQNQEIENLSKQIGERHPRMIQAREDLQTLQSMLNTETQTVIQSVKNAYELARERQNNLNSLLSEAKYEASVISDKMFQYEILNRDVSVHRLLYDRLISRIKEYDATDTKATINVYVVEAARQPNYPINSNRPKRTVLLGLMGSMMAALGLVVFVEHLDNKVKTSEDIETRVEIPVLGMLPFFKDKKYNIEKAVHELPKSLISERYKAIRTAILLSPERIRSLLVVSMEPETGKTTTATNLALALAHSELKVLLMDADMRKPRLHTVFGLVNSRGLSSCLSGDIDIPVFKTKETPYLYILTSGPVPDNPSELLSSSRLLELLERLKEDYDLVIVDSPPLAEVTDGLLITRQAGRTLLVVRSGQTTYDSLEKAEKLFKSLDVSLMGLVVNCVDEKRLKYFHYRYYGTYGIYADGKEKV